jgi:hypothetical protein
MSKTPFSKKCEILGILWAACKDNEVDEAWKVFFSKNDIAGSLCFTAWRELATIKPSGKVYVEETWKDLCESLLMGADEKFLDVDDFFDKVKERRDFAISWGYEDE